jgi:hypothetical protein
MLLGLALPAKKRTSISDHVGFENPLKQTLNNLFINFGLVIAHRLF